MFRVCLHVAFFRPFLSAAPLIFKQHYRNALKPFLNGLNKELKKLTLKSEGKIAMNRLSRNVSGCMSLKQVNVTNE